MDETYDVVVVGGGAAGLGAGLTLARARRAVLVVDGGEPRNAPAEHVHNYLGREGTPPRELLAAGRAEVTGYGGHVLDGTVTAVTREHPGFRVLLGDGGVVRARRLIVASGLVDELPDVPGLAPRWGRDVLHCPYCHGWEVRDQPIGVLATGPLAVHQALLFRQWSAEVTLFAHTAPELTADQQAMLAGRGITVVTGEVAAVEVTRDQVAGLRMADGDVVPCRAVVVQSFFRARSAVLDALGIEPVEMMVDGHAIGTHVPTDPTGATTVPGVWAAGNVTDPRAQVIAAAAAGVTVAATVNADLVMEDSRIMDHTDHDHADHDHHGSSGHAGEGGHHPMPPMDEQSWEQRYRSATAAVWSGRPNPQLVTETAELTPGTALDAGSGEGGDALWLAARGWQVTGVDFATAALRRAAEHAEALGGDVAERVRWVHADLTEWTPQESYDLVSAHFVHLPSLPRGELFARLAGAVAPGGTLLLVGHHPDDMGSQVGRPAVPDMFFTAEQLADALDPDGWELLTVDARPRPATHDGREVTVRDAVLRARRRTVSS
jgi:thioredoxin reductase/SAM-dependent methyltransferase